MIINKISKRGSTKNLAGKGVYFIENSRKKQKMPHNYQFYQDFIANENRLSIENAARKISVPHLIVHGESDNAVPFLKQLN